MKSSTLGLGLVVALGLMCAVPAVSMADNMMKADSMKVMKEGMIMNDKPVAISGFCPVCVFHGMMNKGSDNFTTEYKGKVYKFPAMEQQKAFINNPEQYAKDLEMKYKAMGGK